MTVIVTVLFNELENKAIIQPVFKINCILILTLLQCGLTARNRGKVKVLKQSDEVCPG